MADLYRLVDPLLRRIDPESAHRSALALLRAGLVPADRGSDDPVLACELFGRKISNPIGLAAGFDKNAMAVDRVGRLGFGFVELGGVTPRPQPGNPRPRLFRLQEDRAVINRMGFNNDGMQAIGARLVARKERGKPVGINLASNSDTTDPAGDFAALVAHFTPIADYLTVDISCPNTPNGKIFQQAGPLDDLLAQLKDVRSRTAKQVACAEPPMLIKSAPDLTEAEKAGIAAAALKHRIDGMIISNTTTHRSASLRSRHKSERGGLSGQPLFAASTALLGDFRVLTEAKIPLIGVGGIFSGQDAYAKIRAGASAVQLYTALVFEGPGLVRRIKNDLAALLKRDGFSRLADAVGVENRQTP